MMMKPRERYYRMGKETPMKINEYQALAQRYPQGFSVERSVNREE